MAAFWAADCIQTAYRGYETTIWLRSEASIERARLRLAPQRGVSGIPWRRWRPILESLRTASSLRTRLLQEARPAEGAGRARVQPQAHSLGRGFWWCWLCHRVRRGESGAQRIEFYTIWPSTCPEDYCGGNSSTMIPSMFAVATGRREVSGSPLCPNEIERQSAGHGSQAPLRRTLTWSSLLRASHPHDSSPRFWREQPGYLLNSMLVPLLVSAEQLLGQTASATSDIDRAWRIGTGSPKGRSDPGHHWPGHRVQRCSDEPCS